MLKSLKLENFRGFKSFELQQLGRINLLVGSNNSGKTSILEAIDLLQSRANLTSLKNQMLARGELSIGEDQEEEITLDAQQIFHNYSASEDVELLLKGELENGSQLILRIAVWSENLEKSFYVHGQVNVQGETKGELMFPKPEASKNQSLITKETYPFLRFGWEFPKSPSSIGVDIVGIRVFPGYAISMRELREYVREDILSTKSAYFIRSSSLTSYEMTEIFNRVVLTPDEELVNRALQVIEPTIQRIASMGINLTRRNNNHGNFFVLRSDINQRVPIGNMGEGMWRMLGLALGLINAKGGILLVDDIDTGLHFSTMVGMWKMIWETAKRLDVQVFATTHNSDCWTSLAEIARSQDAAEQGITIHRIEKDKQRSVVFNERKIVIAADQDIEVR
ncbi:hypothetical protein NIES2135_21940 [Leptolyngbya boryana NIES-2135]|jgi:AAA15 family ATPase/GTPase|uniref:ATPase AAA-type core domain-containing protein n=1 Tax=Leptolyngbya boryana NIES-2135 TaxID=1973484 RepID=A0A1Z4JF57_LEPBY|nr:MULTISPECIES: ATP-binding protein [Leptolyngbya]BAY55371.1 hypothetical protein NIES2135_21940 [Leptolyngbya boryana NIES-2135]MBD2368475.1 AAA family ATPase [Leptolyngbya sp. FACHB-161]MBD2374869.1 AAA family ATPase [Leptolyngbya sp. FACHB-238]MBD2399289.1 AAA family ATPase [Leptolyngbya sp. FACHB-239]MBD2405494.1 AAA family ATPase [Leptolyngbya sp. FACHB-402]